MSFQSYKYCVYYFNRLEPQVNVSSNERFSNFSFYPTEDDMMWWNHSSSTKYDWNRYIKMFLKNLNHRKQTSRFDVNMSELSTEPPHFLLTFRQKSTLQEASIKIPPVTVQPQLSKMQITNRTLLHFYRSISIRKHKHAYGVDTLLAVLLYKTVRRAGRPPSTQQTVI